MHLNINIRKCFGENYNIVRNFHPFKVVGRGSETQL